MKWCEVEIEFLKDNYGKLDIENLKKILNHSESGIRHKAFKLNLTKNYSWTAEEIKYLIDDYENRYKKDLAISIDRSKSSIRRESCKLGLKRNNLPIDEDFFKNWNKEMAYIFGFWIADGNMSKNSNVISFSSNDYNLLEMIKSNLKSGHKISKNNNAFKLQICNKTLYNDLLNLGGIPRKSLTIQFPEVPDEFLSHFIRGEFDGDGSNFIFKIGKHRYLNSSFAGNVDFLTVLKDKIEEYANIDVKKLNSCDKKCNPRIKQLCYRGKKAIALCDFMYQDSESLRLERKFKIYDQMKKRLIKN